MDAWFGLAGELLGVVLLLLFCWHQIREMNRLKAEREAKKKAEAEDSEP